MDQTAPPKNGPAWAVLLSGGIGGLVFGVLTDISECSAAASTFFQRFYRPAGSLSGVAVCSVLIWIVVWIVLHFRWNKKQIENPRALMTVIMLLCLFAFITTFPPFYELIGG